MKFVDDSLQFGRAWHRLGYCYRNGEPLRILDAGCGPGGSAIQAAILNPQAYVHAVDVSSVAVELARSRGEAIALDRLNFSVHDLTSPLPASWGRFEFIICRDSLTTAVEPQSLLRNLADCLEPNGLLSVAFRTRSGRETAHALRSAIEAVSPPDASMSDRFHIGVELLQGLRPDHPLRAHIDPDVPPERIVEDAFQDCNEWTLAEATKLLESVGLKLLYVATSWRWQPECICEDHFASGAVSARLERLGQDRLARLMDALNPELFESEYKAFACLKEHVPVLPAWPKNWQEHPEVIDNLIPHLTYLAHAADLASSLESGCVGFQTILDDYLDIDRLSTLRLRAVDGKKTCGAINQELASQTRANDDLQTRQRGWINLADRGLILLEPWEQS
jgi:SAM-dependent methyltransferase